MQFLCVEENKSAVASLSAETAQTFANPSAAEALIISACRVKRKPASQDSPRIYEPLSPAGGTFRAAIGRVAQAPIAGTYRITYGANTTSSIAYNASAAAVQAELNALASISGITPTPGVTVAADDDGFIVTFNSTGTRSQFSTTTTSLAPDGTVGEIGRLVTGAIGIQDIQYIRFLQAPAAFADLTSAAPDPAGTVDAVAVGGGAVNAKYRVNLFTTETDGSVLNAAYDGRWSITFNGEESGLIAWDASGDDALAIIEAMDEAGAGNVSVTRERDGVYLIGFKGDHAGEDMGTMTVDCSALKVIPYLTGSLPLNNPAVQLLFDGGNTAEALMVIEFTPVGGEKREVYRQPRTIDQALIAPSALVPAPVVGFYTSSETNAYVANQFATFLSNPAGQAFSGPLTATLINGLDISGAGGASLAMLAPLFLNSGADVAFNAPHVFNGHGVATLAGGTATVSASSITTNTRILLAAQTLGTVAAPKALGVTARSVGASFTITSADATDTSTVAYMLIEP